MLDVFEATRLLIAEEDERLSRLLGGASTSELKALWSYSGDLQRWAAGMLKARGESPSIRLEFSADAAEEADRAYLALLRVVDARGIEWQLGAVISDEAKGELGVTAPAEDVLRKGAKLLEIKVVGE